ncbi:MAG: excinuclease ABC subunit UvrB [bacterium]
MIIMFKLVSNYTPSGDQPEAIKQLVENINNNKKEQVLLGATGTGKTFTISNVIKEINKPTLILAHNKTLAGQLYSEFKQFFPENHVEYFISYYDYYQPEAYVVSSDTYIEKDSQINEEIDEMRHSATASLMEHKDVIIIASVSCIYGIGDPETYKNSMLLLRVGNIHNRKELLKKLIDMLYDRNELDFKRGTFRFKGDILEIIPSYERKQGIRVQFFDEEIEKISEFDVTTGKAINHVDYITIFPATHFVTDKEKMEEATRRIKEEMKTQYDKFIKEDKFIEAQRIKERTNYDMEMLEQMGYCNGVENYSRHLTLKNEGDTPYTLIDFLGDDYLLVIDESHVTLPQVRGMYNGDRARKENLVNYGFRLPSALDNRPLQFHEFEEKTDNVIYVSATPGDYEKNKDLPVIQQIIRPTGLLDPVIEIRPSEGQIDDLYAEIVKRTKLNQRVLVTTLTIKMSEDLAEHLKSLGVKVAYLHSEIKSLERIEIIRDLRLGKYDALIGINLLREGLDIPEVSLVTILDADKQGFLRSERSLIQTIGRAARNQDGLVIMYADKISDAMSVAIEETNRRREIQTEYNKVNNITPQTVIKEVRDAISFKKEVIEETNKKLNNQLSISELEEEMFAAAKSLDFERASELRDVIFELKAKSKKKK